MLFSMILIVKMNVFYAVLRPLLVGVLPLTPVCEVFVVVPSTLVVQGNAWSGSKVLL